MTPVVATVWLLMIVSPFYEGAVELDSGYADKASCMTIKKMVEHQKSRVWVSCVPVRKVIGYR